jgi:hypothetical protein
MKPFRLMLLLVLSVFLPLGIAQASKTTGTETKTEQVKKTTPSAGLIDISDLFWRRPANDPSVTNGERPRFR